MDGKFVFIFLENHFEKFRELQSYQLDSLQENCRFLDVRAESCGEIIYIHIYKNDNISQCIRHVKNCSKLFVTRPFRVYSRVLKNLTGFARFLHEFGFVKLEKFEKQNNGIYKKCVIPVFKFNIKEIKSNDFEHYAQDLQLILKTNED
jgi:hypothetical protein